MKCLHFFRYALSSLEKVKTAELSSIITAGSNSGMLSSEHMYMINSMSLTSVYSARISAWVEEVDTRVCLALRLYKEPLGCRPIVYPVCRMYQVAGIDFVVV